MDQYTKLILDFSGTIADDRIASHRSVNSVLSHLGKEEISYEEYHKRITLDFQSFWEGFGLFRPLAELENLYYRFHDQQDPPILIPGNREALATLADQLGKENITVLSALRNHRLIPWIAHLGIQEYLGVIMGGIFAKSETLKGFDPETTLFVGDMEQDALAAKLAKIPFAGIDHSYAYHPIDRLQQHNPRHIITHLNELPALLSNGRS